MLTKNEIKSVDDIIGSHLPSGYRERLLRVVQEIKDNSYNEALHLGMISGTKYPWTS